MRKNLICKRKNSQLTQEELANILGITTRHYQCLEAGTSEGSVKVWKQLAKRFNTTIDYLLAQGDDEPQPQANFNTAESCEVAAAKLSEVISSEMVAASKDLQDGTADTPEGKKVLKLMRQTGGAALAV